MLNHTKECGCECDTVVKEVSNPEYKETYEKKV